ARARGAAAGDSGGTRRHAERPRAQTDRPTAAGRRSTPVIDHGGAHRMGKLDGKVALISGGARGQGAAEARTFVREGARVVFGDVRDDEGQKVEASIRAEGGEAVYVRLDVANEA